MHISTAVFWKPFAQLMCIEGEIDSEDIKSVHWANPFHEPHGKLPIL